MAWRNETEFSNNTSLGKEASLISGVCGLVFFPVILVILFLMLFVYKTYKTTLQRLVVYYIVLSLWYDVSAAMFIVGALTVIDGRWACNILRYLIISSQFAWYTYVTVIANFSLFLTIYLTRVRRRPLSKRSSRCMECICVMLAVTIGLMVASVIEIYNRAHDMECIIINASPFLTKFWVFSMSIYFGMDLEVILVSLSLCVVFCFIRRRIRNRQTAVLLRNSIIHVAINASIMGLDSSRAGYNIYLWPKIRSSGVFPAQDISLSITIIFALAIIIGVSVIVQAVLCIQTSTERNTCCKRCCCTLKEDQHYAVIDGKDTCIASNPVSSRVNQPSYTNFAIPYTGGFTQITASVNSDGESE